jgi:hypothetical protein
MYPRTSAVLLATVACLAAACSDTTAATPSVERLAGEICDLTVRCCDRGERAYLFGPFVTEANCKERLVIQAKLQPSSILEVVAGEDPDLSLPNLAALDEAAEDERIEVSSKAVSACVDYIRAMPCNEPPEEIDPELCIRPEPPLLDPPCDPDSMFIGKVGEGGSCSSSTLSLECKDGMVCRTAPGTLGVEGRCVPVGQVGDFCSDDDECDEDLYCSLLDGTCREFSLLGETCLNGAGGGSLIRCARWLSCDSITDSCVGPCDRGYSCSGDSDCDQDLGLECVSGRCDLLRIEGQPCSSSDDCVEGLRCGLDESGPDSMSILVCMPLSMLGEPCVRHADCVTEFCNQMEGICAETVAAGEPCPSGASEECASGNACVRPASFCFSDTDCPGSTCDLLSNQCIPICIERVPDGATCTIDSECASENCIAGFCRTPPLVDGQECESDLNCESEFCNLDSPRVCATLPLATGELCASSSQCDSGVCFAIGTNPRRCINGALEGDVCASDLPPCDPKEFFCDVLEEDPPRCVPFLPTGEECTRDAECRGDCTARFGRNLCSPTAPPDGAVCDGDGGTTTEETGGTDA